MFRGHHARIGDRFIRLLSVLLMTTLVSCAMARQPSKTPRTAVEQLLLAQAVERSLRDLSVPISDGSSVTVEVTGFSHFLPFQNTTAQTSGAVQPEDSLVHGLRSDLRYVKDAVAGRLGELGYRVQEREEDTRYRIRVLVQALGTEQGETFLGMPPVQGGLLPISLPQLTLYLEQQQVGYMRYSVNIYETATGRFVRATPWYLGTAHYHQYTILFFMHFKRTDLDFSP